MKINHIKSFFDPVNQKSSYALGVSGLLVAYVAGIVFGNSFFVLVGIFIVFISQIHFFIGIRKRSLQSDDKKSKNPWE